MLRSDRLTLTASTLALYAVLTPFSIIGFMSGDWGFGIAGLLIPLCLGLFVLVCLRIRRRIVMGLVARRSPLVSSLPEYAELRERGDIPEEWTPSGHTKTIPLSWVFAAGILLPWFWGPLFGATLGDVGVGLWVAGLLSGTAAVTGLLVLAATQYANRRQTGT